MEDEIEEPVSYRPYTLRNFREIPQLSRFPEEILRDIEVVAQVLPFKTNNFVVDELIDWDWGPDDPLFILNFPKRDMLRPEHYESIRRLLDEGADPVAVKAEADRVRLELNPHPAGQISHNVPSADGSAIDGMQHKYRETVLFFPSQGQTCHAHCTFCFRWPQFVGLKSLKFASPEVDRLIAYIDENRQVSDVLFTGGDPLIMNTAHLASYIEPLLDARLPHLKNIRIGTKALTFWPHRFLSDKDSHALLELFSRVVDSGKHLAIMAHFNHPRELSPEPVKEAIRKIQSTGAVIRTQSPLLRHINDEAALWAEMWTRQVSLGLIPYYMFVARDTGAQHYFAVPLVEAQQIFREAYSRVTGLCRTVRGPSMSANPGKVQVLGVAEVDGEKVIELRFIQGRNPEWVHQPFFARYDENATWLSELKPAFGRSRFFFEEELEDFYRENLQTSNHDDYE